MGFFSQEKRPADVPAQGVVDAESARRRKHGDVQNVPASEPSNGCQFLSVQPRLEGCLYRDCGNHGELPGNRDDERPAGMQRVRVVADDGDESRRRSDDEKRDVPAP